jgi:hypothetical protein
MMTGCMIMEPEDVVALRWTEWDESTESVGIIIGMP